jgi:hypothetical protein
MDLHRKQDPKKKICKCKVFLFLTSYSVGDRQHFGVAFRIRLFDFDADPDPFPSFLYFYSRSLAIF